MIKKLFSFFAPAPTEQPKQGAALPLLSSHPVYTWTPAEREQVKAQLQTYDAAAIRLSPDYHRLEVEALEKAIAKAWKLSYQMAKEANGAERVQLEKVTEAIDLADTFLLHYEDMQKERHQEQAQQPVEAAKKEGVLCYSS